MSTPQTHVRDYYEENYRSYIGQNPAHKLDHYLTMIDRQVVGTQNVSVLDVGCGLGAFLRHATLKRPGWILYGSDIETDAIGRLRAELGEGAKLAVASAGDQPFPDQAFDVVTAWDVLEHLEDPGATINQLKAQLTPEGSLLFVVPVYDGPLGPVITRLDRDPTHLHKLSRAEWLELAMSYFSSVEWHGVFRYLVTPKRYIHLPTMRARRWAPAILIVAKN